MAEVTGKFKLVSSENFDEFMKVLGVNIMIRKAAGLSKPVVEIKQEGDEFVIKTNATFKTSEIRFKLGEEFEETRMDGSVCKSVVNLEDNKLVQKQVTDKEVTIIREVNGDEMKTICSVDDIVCTRVYKKCD